MVLIERRSFPLSLFLRTEDRKVVRVLPMAPIESAAAPVLINIPIDVVNIQIWASNAYGEFITCLILIDMKGQQLIIAVSPGRNVSFSLAVDGNLENAAAAAFSFIVPK